MQADVERTLGNLHVLGALSHNDKLMTNEDAFDIYTPTTLRGLVRTWYGERRGHNVSRIRSTVRGAIEFSQRTLTDLRAYGGANHGAEVDVDVNTLRRETMELQFRRMIDGLRRARDGLENLTQTYREDAALSSQIRLVTEEIGDFLAVMERHAPPRAVAPCAASGAEDKTRKSSGRSPGDPRDRTASPESARPIADADDADTAARSVCANLPSVC